MEEVEWNVVVMERQEKNERISLQSEVQRETGTV